MADEITDPIPELVYLRESLRWRATGVGDSVGNLGRLRLAGGGQLGAVADLCRLSADCWRVVFSHGGEWTQPDPIAEMGYLRTLFLLPSRRERLDAFDRDAWALVNLWRPTLEDGRVLEHEKKVECQEGTL